uniref:GST C-terminal domain-containing protein n=1 Tax=Peronospora matthiolae TaxID=2874970 RepID=A0AAV1UDK4_9STRA
MSVSLDQSTDAEFVRFVARFCGVNLSSAASGRLRVRFSNSMELHEPTTIAKYLTRWANREHELLGETAFERALVAMWLDFAHRLQHCTSSQAFALWKVLENSLQQKTYLVGNRVTLADAALFYVLHGSISSFQSVQQKQFVNLVRWFDQVQHTAGVRGFRDLEVIKFEHKPFAFTA